MNYKGIEYSLLQTIAPQGWRWRFEYFGNEYSDSSRTRHGAVLSAQRAIDNLLQLKLTVHG
jgi:YD repeat-containing protein